MIELLIYRLQTDDNRNAIVVSSTSKEARTRAQIYDPTGGWEKAKLVCLGRAFAEFSGDICLERGILVKTKRTRWYYSYSRDLAGFIGWLLFTAGWLVLQGLGRIESFFRRLRRKD